jgi:hypothetical protein
MEDDDKESASRVSLPLLFQVQINLIVPRSTGETKNVNNANVSLSAPGNITGKSSSPPVRCMLQCRRDQNTLHTTPCFTGLTNRCLFAQLPT